MDKKVGVYVEYKINRSYCACCSQKLENPIISGIHRFYFTKDNCLGYLSQENWEIEAEDEYELRRMVGEFVYDTIGYFVASYDVKLIVENSEIEKVKQFILEEVVS